MIRTSLIIAARMTRMLSDRTESRPGFCFFGMRRVAGDLYSWATRSRESVQTNFGNHEDEKPDIDEDIERCRGV
jgi:hypothetical protein